MENKGWLHLLLFGVLVVQAAPGTAATIGPPLVHRDLVDTATGLHYVYQGSFPTVGQRVVSFAFFNDQVANANWITPLIFSFQKGRAWRVTGIGKSRQNTGAGVQSYPFELQSGSDLLADSSYTFGWWNGEVTDGTFAPNSGVFQFDEATSDPGFGESNTFNGDPVVGLSITFANDFSGPNPGTEAGGFGRVYSVQFTSSWPSYVIGSVPPQQIAQGGTLTFQLQSPPTNGVSTFSYTVDPGYPPPQGAIAFDQSRASSHTRQPHPTNSSFA